MHTSLFPKFNNILFLFSLVLFELAVYIANDMIQPAMLEIIKNFNTGIEWVPTSLTAYLAGGLLLQWLFGPLSDKYGRRPIMLIGTIFFTISCLSIFFISNMKQFIIMRFFQGIGLCFIGAVGYATVQEYFEEKICIKIIALMTNVALIAPLLGPLIGVSIINIVPWKNMFLIFAVLSISSFVGLFFFMPETVVNNKKTVSIKNLWNNYKLLFCNLGFVAGSLSIGFANLPLLSWIALSPVILINNEKFSMLFYGILQIPIFSGLIIGNIVLSFFVGNTSLLKLVKLGSQPMLLGLLITTIPILFNNNVYFFIITGFSIYAFGLGIISACLTRLILFSSTISKGTVSSAMGIISMIVLVFGIEFSKVISLFGNVKIFNLINLFSGLLWLILVIIFIKKLKKIKLFKKI